MSDAAVLDAWVRRLEAERVHMAPIQALRSELSGWLPLLFSADTVDHDALMRQVAFHARNLGAEGRPASAAILQIALLEDAMNEVGSMTPAQRPVLRQMLRVVADAHALGASVRQQNNHQAALSRAPIVRLPGQATVGFLVAGMQAQLIDAVLGRLLRAAAGSQEARAILDVSGAPPDDETFHRSLHGFATRPEFKGLTLDVTGLGHPAGTQDALDQLNTPRDRIRLFERLEDALGRTA